MKLFSILPPKETGISFVNSINESMVMNGLTYEYLYNGSGVATGDVNNDGLVDVFFVSSLKNNELYINKGDLKFQNISKSANIEGRYGFSTGVTMVDINADGKLDIYVCKSGKFNNPDKRKNELYVNYGLQENGMPFFKEEANKYNLDLPHQSTQAAFFDYDKDGDLDMFLLNHGTDASFMSDFEKIPDLLNKKASNESSRLYENVDGKYVDVTEKSGIIDNSISFGLGIGIGDLNNDNWPDILVGHDYAEKDQIYLNQKDGTFKEVAHKALRHMSNFSMGNDIADFNNDGLLDFVTVDMVSESSYDIKTSMSGMNPERFYQLTNYGLQHQYMFNALQLNNGNLGQHNIPLFSDIAQLAHVSNTDWSWAPLFFDMDNDGNKDLFVSNGIKRDFRNNDYVSYKKKRTAKYLKDKKASKNIRKLQEGYITDLMKRMPSRLKSNSFYRNEENLLFKKKNVQWKVDALTSTTGAAYADLDNDGDLDIVTNNVDDFAFIYRNNTNELEVGNNYVQFELVGTNKNPNGIGARIEIIHDSKIQIIEQNISRGFQSSISKRIHFGLGTSLSIDTLNVYWPDGKKQRITGLKANKTHKLLHSKAGVNSVEEKSYQSIFKDVTSAKNLYHNHKENQFNDFNREGLLPHRMSQFGPSLAVGDVNGDGLDDFYVGGALDYSGVIYLQNEEGVFKADQNSGYLWHAEKQYEDIASLFFDADLDGDLDLYVVSGGNEYNEGTSELQDRLYLNDGMGNFKKYHGLPELKISGGAVKAADFDNDGDLDLCIGGRQTPGKYPYPTSSVILRNDTSKGNVQFSNVTKNIAPELENIGMVTDMNWVDIDGDSDLDLVIVGEWMALTVFENEGGYYSKKEKTGLESHVGWWNTIEHADFDKDGDIDFIVGNLGLNYKYKASPTEPFEIYAKDFDNNRVIDIVLGYYDSGNLVPLRGRECSSNQMPFVKEKFKNYDAFGRATLKDVYGEQNMANALNYKATNFASSYIENLGTGAFKIYPLPNMAQLSSVNTVEIGDFNNDEDLDILLAGNLYGSEVETPRNDASYGLLLLGDGKGHFNPVTMEQSGVCLSGDVKSSQSIKLKNEEKGIVFGKNQDALQILKIN
ncbi:FG-GAP-like repeat-containing protein [Seonamhaeicola sp.]|uniref:FG-GAP-like repeat-containing protein n=1 Tax=Seonamhaeicola sp. TaxID=1912245 RepID=UPI00263133EB|nr:FG-GAP-like repeat-containing protein [Seonamhaeicola sp.]